tara:strand:- start:77 stop:544 length:468 start_codon:yes stop_codon:yes gene_type:complete
MGLSLIITNDDIQWAREAVDKARVLFPRFCSHGAYPYNRKDPLVFEDHYLEGVVISREWLDHFEVAKNFNKEHGSYGCKHFAEYWSGKYVCNGALIAAAAGIGIRQKLIHESSPNTFLAIKYSSWKLGSEWDIQYRGPRLKEVIKEFEGQSWSLE